MTVCWNKVTGQVQKPGEFNRGTKDLLAVGDRHPEKNEVVNKPLVIFRTRKALEEEVLKFIAMGRNYGGSCRNIQ